MAAMSIVFCASWDFVKTKNNVDLPAICLLFSTKGSICSPFPCVGTDPFLLSAQSDCFSVGADVISFVFELGADFETTCPGIGCPAAWAKKALDVSQAGS